MPNNERALRKMIAELAEMPAQACNAILDQLSDRQNERVRALLEEYRGAGQAPVLASIDPQGLPQNLSPWLLDLLDTTKSADAAPVKQHLPTRHAVDALKACVAELRSVSLRTEETKSSRWQAIAKRLPDFGRKVRA